MADEQAYNVVTVGGGKCLDNTQSAHGVLDCIPKGSDSQKWFIETDPNDANVVAFKSSIDGKYLRNNQPAHIYKATIGVGEKQWWTLEKGKNPGSCLIRSNACTAGASYLNDFEGKYQDRNYVHMWGMDQNRQFWLDWYILPADAGFNPKEAAGAKAIQGAANNESQQKAEELDAKEVELKKKEQDLAEREATLKNQTSADEEAAQDATSDGSQQRTRDLDAGEADLKKREQDVAAREAALRQRTSDANMPVQNRKADDASQNNNRLELLRAENDNLKLKLKIQDLEEQLKKARKPQTNGSAGKAVNGHAVSHTNGLGKKDPVVYECGHVAYPPPRKLRHHVVGILYEGLDQPYELSDRQRATLSRHEHHHD